MSSNLNILLADYRDRAHLYDNFVKRYHTKCNILKDISLHLLESYELDIILVTHENFFGCPSYIQYAKENNIPSLLLMDGMVEWRNNWRFPLIKSVVEPALYQPVSCDKVACISGNQVNILEDWGNYGKCEDIGYPSYDHLTSNDDESEAEKESTNILVTSANTPYFDENQKTCVEQSYRDLNLFFEKTPVLGKKAINTKWRLPKSLSDACPPDQSVVDFKKIPIWEQLKWADVVVSSPSTIMLATMVLKKPFVLIDYTCSPLYITPTWHINHQGNMGTILKDAVSPPEDKRVHQEFFLQNNLSNIGTASDKLFELICAQVDEHRGIRKKEIYLIKNSRLDRIDLNVDFPKLQSKENKYYLTSNKLQIISENKRLKKLLENLKKTNGELAKSNEKLKSSVEKSRSELKKSRLKVQQILGSKSFRLGNSLFEPVRYLRRLVTKK